jgi:uncharacterized protein (DUF433 family)
MKFVQRQQNTRQERTMKRAGQNYGTRIVRDQRVCGGQAVFKGTRVTLRTVLASLAEADSPEQILTDFPSLKPEDIQAAIMFAATCAHEHLPVPELPDIPGMHLDMRE